MHWRGCLCLEDQADAEKFVSAFPEVACLREKQRPHLTTAIATHPTMPSGDQAAWSYEVKRDAGAFVYLHGAGVHPAHRRVGEPNPAAEGLRRAGHDAFTRG
jgi:hypothetical protein